MSASVAGATSAGAAVLPPGFVRLADLAPQIVQDVRYAGPDNFTGRPVPGYEAAECWARREMADALATAAAEAERRGYRLVIYDCYRPQRATDAFVKWAQDPADQIAKTRFYPSIDKRLLFEKGYIGRRSSHSAGVAVDLGLQKLDGGAVDFGTIFDLFDPRSATASKQVSAAARQNRALLKQIMEPQGFANYAREWWHYTLKGFADAPLHDVPIR
jgi:D-alanyl-D-alanine dipeptidase